MYTCALTTYTWYMYVIIWRIVLHKKYKPNSPRVHRIKYKYHEPWTAASLSGLKELVSKHPKVCGISQEDENVHGMWYVGENVAHRTISPPCQGWLKTWIWENCLNVWLSQLACQVITIFGIAAATGCFEIPCFCSSESVFRREKYGVTAYP